jgi:type II secretory pathway pseudopilin PulG
MIVPSLTAGDIAVGVAVLIGLLSAGRGVVQYRRRKAVIGRAETTTGSVEAADIEQVRGAHGSVSYIPAVEYTYQTPTQRRRGETVYPGKNRFAKQFGTESAANAAVADYEVDAQTRVYYDPAEPAHSFLDPELQNGALLTQVGVGVMCFGLAALGYTVL